MSRSARFLLLLGSMAFGSGGTLACTYGDHDRMHDDGYQYDPPGPTDIESSTIDTDATIAEIEPGSGAGAFVEVQTGGKWRLYTACDTDLSGYSCDWDVIITASVDADIESFEEENLESSDWVDWEGSDSLRFIANNATDFDGFRFQATPGATMRVDVYLDAHPAHRYIYWVGDGGLHQGAPTNPIDLVPSAP